MENNKENLSKETREYLESKGYKYISHFSQKTFFILPSIYLIIYVDDNREKISQLYFYISWLKWDIHFKIK